MTSDPISTEKREPAPASPAPTDPPPRGAGRPDALSVDRLGKVFPGGAGVHALDNIDLEITEGSFTCLVGPSGCGKSTLLRILGGLEPPTSGTVSTGVAATGDIPTAAFVFQEHGVFPWLDVVANVAFGEHMAGVGRRDRESHARHWIGEVGLSGFEHAYPHQLSGGMRQRIAIARAFCTGSPVLLMDEPLGALDAQTRMLMQEQLLRLWEHERKTVVLVTHSIEEALLLGDEIVVMSARPGRIKSRITVPFGRPRTVEVESSPDFARLKGEIWDMLRDEVNASMGWAS